MKGGQKTASNHFWNGISRQNWDESFEQSIQLQHQPFDAVYVIYRRIPQLRIGVLTISMLFRTGHNMHAEKPPMSNAWRQKPAMFKEQKKAITDQNHISILVHCQ